MLSTGNLKYIYIQIKLLKIYKIRQVEHNPDQQFRSEHSKRQL